MKVSPILVSFPLAPFSEDDKLELIVVKNALELRVTLYVNINKFAHHLYIKLGRLQDIQNEI